MAWGDEGTPMGEEERTEDWPQWSKKLPTNAKNGRPHAGSRPTQIRLALVLLSQLRLASSLELASRGSELMIDRRLVLAVLLRAPLVLALRETRYSQDLSVSALLFRVALPKELPRSSEGSFNPRGLHHLLFKRWESAVDAFVTGLALRVPLRRLGGRSSCVSRSSRPGKLLHPVALLTV